MRSHIIIWFARSITRHPGRYLLVLALGAASAACITSQLTFESSYLALLPEGAPEVKTIERVRQYTGGTNELVIAIGGPEDRRLPFARRMVRRLSSSGLVQWAQAEYPVEFLKDRSLLLLSTSKLQEIETTLRTEVNSAKAKANPLLVDLEDDEERQAQLQSLRKLEAESTSGQAKLSRTRSTADGRYLLVFVKPRATASQLAETGQVLEGIRSQVDAAQSPQLRLPVRYAGNLVSSIEENQTMSRDFTWASGIALILAVLLITLTTRRISATLVIGAPLLMGLVFTLAVATVVIGHLNLVSGFLVAALVGLGIDFGIHLYLRFLDESVTIFDPREAMRRAITGTFWACFTAAATTAAAFLSLLVADFRGFSEYGLIAAIGVMLTLFVTYLALPPLALLVGRLSPRQGTLAVQKDRKRLLNTRQLARPLAWAMLACGLAFVTLSATSLGKVSFQNNFKQLKGASDETAFEDYITKEVGGSLAPALIMVDGFKQTQQAEQLIKARLADPSLHSPIDRVFSAASLVPTQVNQKARLLSRIRDHVDTLLSGAVKPADAKKLQEVRRLASASPWTISDLPDAFRQRLVAGSQDKFFLLLWSQQPLVDGASIQAWAKELTAVMDVLSQAGIQGEVLDENLVAARVLDLIRRDGPRVMVVAAVAVLLILLLDFRRPDRVLLVGGSVFIGMIAMLGTMALFDLHLNLFNAVVLPTVLGIGIDNAVHLQHAYLRRGRGSIPLVVATSGRAALLSSATTAIGFGSAIIAHHVGIQQMAILALVGIGCTFTSSTILFPALLRALERRRAGAGTKEPPGVSAPAPIFNAAPPAPASSSVVTR